MTNFSSVPVFSLQQRFYSRQASKASLYLQTVPFVVPQLVLLVSILHTWCLWTTSPFVSCLIVSFHTISCGSKFLRFTTHGIKKLFPLSVLNKPNATFIISLPLLLHDVLKNISTFTSPSASTFCKSLWHHTTDSWLCQSFNFPSRGSDRVTLIIQLLFLSPSLTSVCVPWGVLARKAYKLGEDGGAQHLLNTEMCILSCYPHFHLGVQNLIGFSSSHCTLSQRFQTPENMKPRFLTWTITSSFMFSFMNHQWLYRFFGCFSYLHWFKFIHIGVYLSAICTLLWELSATHCQQKNDYHIYRVGYSSAYFFFRSWAKIFNKIASRTNPYWLVSWKVSSL